MGVPACSHRAVAAAVCARACVCVCMCVHVCSRVHARVCDWAAHGKATTVVCYIHCGYIHSLCLLIPGTTMPLCFLHRRCGRGPGSTGRNGCVQLRGHEAPPLQAHVRVHTHTYPRMVYKNTSRMIWRACHLPWWIVPYPPVLCEN